MLSYTVDKKDQWVNEIDGAEFGGPHSTKEEAVSAGRTRARHDQPVRRSRVRPSALFQFANSLPLL